MTALPPDDLPGPYDDPDYGPERRRAAVVDDVVQLESGEVVVRRVVLFTDALTDEPLGVLRILVQPPAWPSSPSDAGPSRDW